MSYIEYKGEEVELLMNGFSIWVIGDPSGCPSCSGAKMKLPIIAKNNPLINFIFLDYSIYPNLDKIVDKGFTPLAFPYTRSYINNKCIQGAYSAEVYIIEDLIKKLYEESDK